MPPSKPPGCRSRRCRRRTWRSRGDRSKPSTTETWTQSWRRDPQPRGLDETPRALNRCWRGNRPAETVTEALGNALRASGLWLRGGGRFRLSGPLVGRARGSRRTAAVRCLLPLSLPRFARHVLEALGDGLSGRRQLVEDVWGLSLDAFPSGCHQFLKALLVILKALVETLGHVEGVPPAGVPYSFEWRRPHPTSPRELRFA